MMRKVWFGRVTTWVVTLAVVGGSFAFASRGDRVAVAGDSELSFDSYTLPAPPESSLEGARRLSPSYEFVAGWMDSVGAGIALGDLSGNGREDDVCRVDPRLQHPVVQPALPGGYDPISLTPEPLAYDSTMAPMGCAPGDFTGDGALDLLVYYWGRTPVLFESKTSPGGTPHYEPREVIDSGGTWNTNAVAISDFDGDGNIDVFVGNYFPEDAGILNSDQDRVPVMHESFSNARNGGTDAILLGDGTGGFTSQNLPREAGPVFRGWTLAAAAADVNEDGLPELYIANDHGRDYLLHNQSHPGEVSFSPVTGERTLTAPGSNILGADSFKGMGADFADLSNHGRPDLFVSNLTEEWALQESNYYWKNTGQGEALGSREAPFENVAEAAGVARTGWSWDVKTVDLASDGHRDIVMAHGFAKGKINRWPEIQELATANEGWMRNIWAWPKLDRNTDLSGAGGVRILTRGTQSGRYEDAAAAAGVTESLPTRAIATGDINGDGAVDLAYATQWGDAQVLLNTTPQSSSVMLDLRLENGAPAVGAEVRIEHPNGGERWAQVDGGSGHSGKRAHTIHFGLGNQEANLRVPAAIQWRSQSGVLHTANVDLSLNRSRLILHESGTVSHHDGD